MNTNYATQLCNIIIHYMLYYEYQLDNEMLHILYMILTYLKVSVYTLMYTYIIYIYCMNIYNL